MLPENTTVSTTVNLASLSSSSTDSQTIAATLSGTILELLPENTTVSTTVNLASLSSSSTDSQTIAATLSGTILELLPENTTVSSTIELIKLDRVGDVLSLSSIDDVVLLTTSATLYTVPVGKTAKIGAILPKYRIGGRATDYGLGFQNSYDFDFTILINGVEIYIGQNKRVDTGSGGTDAHPYTGETDVVLIKNQYYLPAGTTIRLGQNTGFLNIIEFDSNNINSRLITGLSTVPVNKKWKVMGFLNSQNIGNNVGRTDNSWSININGVTHYIASIRWIGSAMDNSDADILYKQVKYLFENEIILPSGTTLEPGPQMYGLSIIEF